MVVTTAFQSGSHRVAIEFAIEFVDDAIMTPPKNKMTSQLHVILTRATGSEPGKNIFSESSYDSTFPQENQSKSNALGTEILVRQGDK